MAAPGKEAYRASYCDEGYFVTLKQLKEVKFGNTVRITEIKSPIVPFGVPKEVNDDPDSWDAFSKIFITSNPANLKMMNPIEGLKFSSIHQHAWPALSDGFFRTYKKSWMDSFR